MTVDPDELLNGLSDAHLDLYHTSRDVMADDVSGEAQAKNVVVPISGRSKESGRKALYKGCCQIHGCSVYGADCLSDPEQKVDGHSSDCTKFVHLPGNGRGPFRPSPFRIIKVLLTTSIKPLFFLSIIGTSIYFLQSGGLFAGKQHGSILRPSSLLPSTEQSVPIVVRPTQVNPTSTARVGTSSVPVSRHPRTKPVK